MEPRILVFGFALGVGILACFAACSGEDDAASSPHPKPSSATLEKCATVLGTEHEDECADAELVAMSRAQRELVREMAEASAACKQGPVEESLDCYREASCDPFRSRAARLDKDGFPVHQPENALASGSLCGE